MFAHSFVLVTHSELNVSTHSESSRQVGKGAQAVRAGNRGTWFQNMGVCEGVTRTVSTVWLRGD